MKNPRISWEKGCWWGEALFRPSPTPLYRRLL